MKRIIKRAKRQSRQNTVAYAAAISATLYCPFFANATSVTQECNYSSTGSSFTVSGETMPACPVGVVGPGISTTTNALRGGPGYYPGIRIHSNPAQSLPIYMMDATSVVACRWLSYSSSPAFFVPMATTQEYQAFLSVGPTKISGIGMQTCSVPYSIIPGMPSTQSFPLPSFLGSSSCNTGTFTYNRPNVYGKTGVSVYPSTPDTIPFACRGTTNMTSSMQWTAGNVEATGAATNGWTPTLGFSPDLALSPSASTVYQPGYAENGYPATVTLYWYINPNPSGSNNLTCYTNFGGPDSAGNPRSGSVTVNLYGYSTYTLTCYEGSSLVSTTSTSVAFVGAPPTPPPPPPPCCYGDGGGYYGGG